MNMKKTKTTVGRWLAGLALLRHGARIFLQLRTLIISRNRSFMAVLSMGERMHAYSAAHGVRALGHRVLLITDTPQLPEMAYTDAILLRNPLTEPERILAELESFELEGVLVSTDHELLPLQHRIARRFDLITVGSETVILNNDKLAWRDALALAGVAQPTYSSDPAFFDGQSCIRKPRLGSGSRDVITLKPEDYKFSHSGPEFYFESAVLGDQYDFEGVVRNGKVHILVRLFEKYRQHNRTFVSQYYFFNPPIEPAREAALDACTRSTLAASKVKHGAFHIEMRMNGDYAVPIDFANRISAVERGVSFCINGNFAQAHAGCFLAGDHPLPVGEPRTLLQYWCWTQDEFDHASEISEANPERVF